MSGKPDYASLSDAELVQRGKQEGNPLVKLSWLVTYACLVLVLGVFFVLRGLPATPTEAFVVLGALIVSSATLITVLASRRSKRVTSAFDELRRRFGQKPLEHYLESIPEAGPPADTILLCLDQGPHGYKHFVKVQLPADKPGELELIAGPDVHDYFRYMSDLPLDDCFSRVSGQLDETWDVRLRTRIAAIPVAGKVLSKDTAVRGDHEWCSLFVIRTSRRDVFEFWADLPYCRADETTKLSLDLVNDLLDLLRRHTADGAEPERQGQSVRERSGNCP